MWRSHVISAGREPDSALITTAASTACGALLFEGPQSNIGSSASESKQSLKIHQRAQNGRVLFDRPSKIETAHVSKVVILNFSRKKNENEDEDEEKNRQLSDEISLLTQELHEILEKIKTYHTIEFKRLLQGEKDSQELLISLQSIITNIEGNLSGYLGGQSPRDPSKDYMCKTINLNGPVTYHYLISPDRKKRVYLFGDFHTQDAGCDSAEIKIKFIKLEELIENTIFANSDQIIEYSIENFQYIKNKVFKIGKNLLFAGIKRKNSAIILT